MATAALRPCATPKCSALVSKGHCDSHARQQDTARGTAQERGYDYQWSLYSQSWRQQHPFCGERMDGLSYRQHRRADCVGDVPANVVDHIRPMSKGGSKWEPGNHQSLCLACNSAKGDK